MTAEIKTSPETPAKISAFSILFVDDEENARKYFAKALKNDFNVLTAGNVAEAQEILREKNSEIAVIITDQRMPGGNGVVLLKFVRENYPHIIRLLTTAYSDLSDAIEAVNGGEILRYIQKPWDFNMLKAEMRQAVELFELRFERNQIIHEKIMVKKRMAKVERVKSMILFGKYFSFLNFAEISANNFIKDFSNIEINHDENEDWKSFDFGSYDVLETKFLRKLIEKIQSEIPVNNYQIDSQINSEIVKEIFAQIKQKLNSKTDLKISGNIDGRVSLNAFYALLKNLTEIAEISSNKNIFFEEQNAKISIKISLEKTAEFDQNNIFVTSPKQEPNQLYVNLLACYFLASHHGAVVKASHNDNLDLEISLPKNPDQSEINSTEIHLENLILSSML